MPRFNELLPGRFNEGISAVLGLSEQAGVQTVAPELMPVFEVEREKPEHAFPKKERLGYGGILEAPSALTNAAVALVNPATSTLVLVVEQIFMSAFAAAMVAQMGLTNIPAVMSLASTIIGLSRDTRWLSGTAGLMRSGQLSGPVGPIWLKIPAAETLIVPVDFVVSPGWAFVLSAQLVNLGMNVGMTWRERSLLPEERGGAV